jgi:hypothetical protein
MYESGNEPRLWSKAMMERAIAAAPRLRKSVGYDEYSCVRTTLYAELGRQVDVVVSIRGNDAAPINGCLFELSLVGPRLTVSLVDADGVKTRSSQNPSDIRREILVDQVAHQT